MKIYAVFSHTPNCVSFIGAFSTMENAKECAKEYLTSAKGVMRIATIDCSMLTHNDIWITAEKK